MFIFPLNIVYDWVYTGSNVYSNGAAANQNWKKYLAVSVHLWNG